MVRVFTCCLLAHVFAFGQSDANKGQIVGTVYDPQRRVVTGASIRIENPDTGAVRAASASAEGQYRAVLLEAGSYNVTVQAPGFAPIQFKNVAVGVGAVVTLDATLQLGTVIQTADVRDTLLTMGLPNPTTNIGLSDLQNLPINGRRFQDFATLTPTVQVDPERGQLSFVGQRGINANVMVDGADYNNPFFGGIRGGERSNFAPTVPQSAVQEFQAVTAGYSAEYGRSSGGILNVVTKGGSNQLHGEAFYQIRHKETGLRTPFGVQILETLQQFGGAAGGALKRDHLFWFFAMERQDSRTPGVVRYASLDAVPVTSDNREAYSYYRSLEGAFRRTNNATTLTGRGDYQFKSRGRLTLRYNLSDMNALNAAAVGGAAQTLTTNALNANGTEQERSNTGVAQWTTILTPTTLNDLRISVSKENRPRTSNSTLPGVLDTIGQFGALNFLPAYEEDSRTQINNGVSILRGSHTFKIGGDYNRISVNQLFGFNQFGFFTANAGTIDQTLEVLSLGGPTANRFDNPLVQYQLQIGNKVGALGVHQIAAYGQDSWRINNRFTLDYGLRWEGQKNPAPDTSNASVVSRIQAAALLGGTHLDPTQVPSALNQWMPRLGFTFSPEAASKTIIRGHAGFFYAATPLLVLIDSTNNFRLPPGNVSLSLPRLGSTVYKDLLAIGIDLNQYTLGNLPVLTPDQVSRAASIAGTAPDPFANGRFLALANDFTNPRSLQLGFGADHSLLANWTVGAQFNYVNTVHLERNHDINLPAPQINPADASLRPNFGQVGTFRIARPLSGIDRVVVHESSARSLYRGGTWHTQYRGRRLQAGLNYTLSENLSDDDNERNSSLFYQDATNFKNEYSPARIDARHQVAGYGQANFPWDISLSGSMRYHSGFPIDASAGSDLNGDGNFIAPLAVGGNGASTTDRPYSAPGVSFARNAFRNLGVKSVDLRFLKTFKLGENRRLEFSTEMFNLFNWANIQYDRANLIYGPGIDPSTGAVVPARSTFLQLRLPNGKYDPTNNQVGTPFQAQFGLRFLF